MASPPQRIAEALIINIRNVDRKFRKSCDQILLLNNRIDDMQGRYNRAMKANCRSARYSLRLQLATLEGVRNMFYEYASRCADELETLQGQLIDMNPEQDSEEENDEEETDYDVEGAGAEAAASSEQWEVVECPEDNET